MTDDEVQISKSELVSNAIMMTYATGWLSRLVHLPEEEVLDILQSQATRMYKDLPGEEVEQIVKDFERARQAQKKAKKGAENG